MLKRFYIILIFILSLVIVGALLFFIYQNENALSKTIRESQQPDTRINKLKEFAEHVNNTESGVRSFAITRDKKYLDEYFDLVNTIDERKRINVGSIFIKNNF